VIRDQFVLDLNRELIVDNFAGGGGASCGIEDALGRHVDIAINHDAEAVAMHSINHPQTEHFCEDVWAVDPLEVTKGRPVGFAWFSPDCKHFSKAKGGKPREKKIRGLAWVMVKWAAKVGPRVMVLENVEEFKTWGPLLADGSPNPARKGWTFKSFVKRLKELGYTVEFKEMRACDYGAPTIRKRFFLIARKDGLPIVWPEPTHGAPNSAGVKSGKLKPWRTAAECIDWSLACPSIFERKRPLAEATNRRIARGIYKFVIGAKEPFIVRCNHGGDWFRGQPLTAPMATLTCSRDANGLVVPFVAKTAYKGANGLLCNDLQEPFRTITAQGDGLSLIAPVITEHANATNPVSWKANEPLRTQCAEVKGGHFALVSAFLARNFGASIGHAAQDPSGTITADAGGHSSLIAAHITKFRTGATGSAGDEPLHTITAGPKENPAGAAHAMGVVTAQLVGCGGRAGQSRPRDASEPAATLTAKADTCLVTANLIGAGGSTFSGKPTDIEKPMKTQTTENHTALVTSSIVKLRGDNTGHPTDEPAHTISAGGLHLGEVRAFLIKYYGNEKDGVELRDPMHTIPTVDRFGLVQVQGQDFAIVDIGMRMLTPPELYRAQGFPSSYIFQFEVKNKRGKMVPLSQSSQVRMCGNSVCPPLSRAIALANVPEMAVRYGDEKGASHV